MESAGDGEAVARPRVTIEDVARLAGVSRQTVSRAMNRKSEIGPATRQRVLDAIRVLGYRPSRFARGLARQGSVAIGLLVADLTNPFYPELAAGVLAAAEGRGWNVLVYDTLNQAGREDVGLEVLAGQVDGVAGFLDFVSDETLAASAAALPMVLIDRDGSDLGIASVLVDYAVGVESAIEHLTAKGHRRIGMIDSTACHEVARPREPERRDAYLSLSREHGLPVGPDWVAAGAETVAGGEDALERLLDRHPDVTAVFAFNDMMAIGALRALRRRGRQVPGDCGVVGFDGLEVAELVDPQLTTVHLDKARLGALAVERLATVMTRPDGAGPPDLLQPRLVVRESA